ncbi:MAG: DUF2029 domain-containing protein [Bradymonadaceae bacterium]|nr:DUF2029 domain-containing protein [Lujinxingiaceae bacterium]
MLHEPGAPYKLPESELSPGQTLVFEHPQDASPKARLTRITASKAWVLPVAIFLVSALILSLISWERVTKHSEDTHFVYLANTFNSMLLAPVSEEAAKRREGKVAFELERTPHHRNDWASYWDLTLKDGEQLRGTWMDEQGTGRFRLLGSNEAVYVERASINQRDSIRRYFVSFPPGPAFLMMPLAAIQGYEANDVAFTIFFAALNIMLVFLLLRRLSVGGRSARSLKDNLWLTLLFGFGTVHFWSAVLGQVWFTALIIGVTFSLLYIYCAIDTRHPFWAGLFLALAFATRTPLLFTVVFFAGFLFFPGGHFLRRDQWKDAAKKLALFCIPCLIIGLSLLWMNYLRFESLSEFGHRYLAGGTIGRIKSYGLFNIQFVSKNLTAMFTLLPRFQPEYPYILISKHGISLLLTTPAYIYLFRPLARQWRADKFWWALLWVTVAVTAVPHLLYQNTGYEQFGYRFSLDYSPYLILLLAVGRRPLSWVFKAAVLAGLVVNAFGAITFKRFGQYYSDDFFV